VTATPPANLIRKLDLLVEEDDRIAEELLDPRILADHRAVSSRSIRRSAIADLVGDYRRWRAMTKEQADLSTLAHGDDRELAALARAELPRLADDAEALFEAIQSRLVTADDRSVGSVILEVRAGVGGDEAGLWAGDLVEMYQRFAARRGWSVDPMELSAGDVGGVKSCILAVRGVGVWSELAFESGTHQVKRVPATETQGRIHTSTATVAVMPEPEEVEVTIDPDDVQESITTAQGPGGQNVNKVATAVHLIHRPTGIEVRMQETKSQTQNRVKAWQLLRARIYERQRAEAAAKRSELRNSLIGTAGRAEKIRTYRAKEAIVVDHRLGETFPLATILAGELEGMIEALTRLEVAQRLASL